MGLSLGMAGGWSGPTGRIYLPDGRLAITGAANHAGRLTMLPVNLHAQLG
jgi:hypothetical protein